MRPEMNRAELVAHVALLARVAGARVMEIYAAGGVEVQSKADASPLTAADLASHHAILAGLAQLTPQWPVLSEESAKISWDERKNWQRYWLVDPLDGTKEFINRSGEFTVNIALIEDGFPVLGVVYAPAIDRLYHASKGLGAFREMDAKTIRIKVAAHAGEKLKVVASRSHRGDKLDDFLAGIGEHESLSMGSSLKFCLVAEGSADLYPRLGPTMEWDTAAAQCIVEEAGGAVEDLAGNRLKYSKSNLLNPEFMVFGAPISYWRALIRQRCL